MFIEFMLVGGLVLMVMVIYLAGRHKKPSKPFSGPSEDCCCPPSSPADPSAPSSSHVRHGHHH